MHGFILCNWVLFSSLFETLGNLLLNQTTGQPRVLHPTLFFLMFLIWKGLLKKNGAMEDISTYSGTTTKIFLFGHSYIAKAEPIDLTVRSSERDDRLTELSKIDAQLKMAEAR